MLATKVFDLVETMAMINEGADVRMVPGIPRVSINGVTVDAAHHHKRGANRRATDRPTATDLAEAEEPSPAKEDPYVSGLENTVKLRKMSITAEEGAAMLADPGDPPFGIPLPDVEMVFPYQQPVPEVGLWDPLPNPERAYWLARQRIQRACEAAVHDGGYFSNPDSVFDI